MEKINKLEIDDIPELKKLADNWEQWGIEYDLFIKSNKKEGQRFSWRNGISNQLRDNLAGLTKYHCSFCNGFPFDLSKETIEHFKPKTEFPLIAYQYENLFYCCDKCQSNSNKKYTSNLKPDHSNYQFTTIFYIDLYDFKIKILGNLETENVDLFNRADEYLTRYGINQKVRITRREGVYRDLKNYFKAEYGEENQRVRDDFAYRYLYDILLEKQLTFNN